MYKVLFLDMDNTIAENITCQDVPFEQGMYLNKRPINFVIDAVNDMIRPGLDHLVIVTQVQGEGQGINEKQEWLLNHDFYHDVFIHITDDTAKSKFMLDFCNMNGYKPADCLVVDDKKTVLQDAEHFGFNTMYPQQLLVEYYEWLNRNKH
jgi:hypothetical protein